MSSTLDPDITLARTEDGWWVARNPKLGVTTQGETREQALRNLDEAVEGAKAALESEGPAPVPKAPWFDHES